MTNVAPFQSIVDASRTTGLSRTFLREGCTSGTIPHIRSGCKYLINIPQLMQMLNAKTEVKSE